MKKISTLFIVAILATGFIYAGGGRANSVVSITKDAGTAYKFILNNEVWTDGDWGANAAVDLMALATLSGTNTSTLEVAMSKNQYYTGGNWNSLVPGGQAVEYSNIVTGYKATFTKSITTGISNGSDKVIITGNNGRVEAQFAGAANITGEVDSAIQFSYGCVTFAGCPVYTAQRFCNRSATYG